MDNAQKAIMIGVGLFITLLIIAAVMALVNLATGLIGEGTNKVISLNDALVNSLYRDILKIFVIKIFKMFLEERR